jgi:hypothetical protein
MPSVREQILSMDPEALFADGWDDAIIGTTDSWGPGGRRVLRVVYSATKIIEIMMTRDGMDFEESVEYFEYNVAGTYAGERTPIYVQPLEE